MDHQAVIRHHARSLKALATANPKHLAAIITAIDRLCELSDPNHAVGVDIGEVLSLAGEIERFVARWRPRGRRDGVVYSQPGWARDTDTHTRALLEAARLFEPTLTKPGQASTAGGEAVTAIRVFVSHSSRDADLAQRLADLILRALHLEAGQILCTSVAAYKLPPGAHSSSTLLSMIKDAPAFVGVLSKNSLDSIYVLCEIGARWGTGKPFVLVLGPDSDYGALRAPLSEYHVAKSSDRASVLQVLDAVALVTGHSLQPAHTYEDALAGFVGWLPPPAAT